MSADESEQTGLPSASLWQLFWVFARIASTSFGGGLTGWMMREIVYRLRWMDETEFLAGLAMAQALPGVNVVNVAIWVGYRISGAPGAVAAAGGVIVPPALISLVFASIYGVLSRYPEANHAFVGVASAAMGLTGAMCVRAARPQVARLASCAIMVLTFIGVGIFKLPMLAVVAVMAPISIALAWREEQH